MGVTGQACAEVDQGASSPDYTWASLTGTEQSPHANPRLI